MKKRIGTKIYDTDKAVLVETRDDGSQVYRKTGRSREFFLYNPAGKNKHEMFFELLPEDAEKYLPKPSETKVFGSPYKIIFSPYDSDRIRRNALKNKMSMSKFLLMLVDEYEQRQK
jgi:hypothetical protein